MAIYKCGECDGSLDLLKNGLGKCQYCGALQTLPKDNDERVKNVGQDNELAMTIDGIIGKLKTTDLDRVVEILKQNDIDTLTDEEVFGLK